MPNIILRGWLPDRSHKLESSCINYLDFGQAREREEQILAVREGESCQDKDLWNLSAHPGSSFGASTMRARLLLRCHCEADSGCVFALESYPNVCACVPSMPELPFSLTCYSDYIIQIDRGS